MIEMDAQSLVVGCNLPELLVNDLETSTDIFTSKAMTAGSPRAGLAACEWDAGPSFYRPLLPYRAINYQHHSHHPHLSHHLHHHSHQPYSGNRTPPRQALLLTTDNARPCPEQPPQELQQQEQQQQQSDDGSKDRGVENSSPDSLSVTSVGVGPLSVRTRQQSVATAATSLSGRCSSLFSTRAFSPTSPVLSPCSSNQESSPQGTWFEDDELESPQDGPQSEVFTARTSISDPHLPAVFRADDDDRDSMAASQKSTADWDGIPAATTLHFTRGCYGTHSRPQTPAAQLQLEKPRIVDILPVTLVSKRTTSTKRRGHGSVATASIASEPRDATAVLTVAGSGWPRQGVYHDSHLPEQLEPMVSLLATANGRTVIDASTPPPISFVRRGQPVYHHSRSPSPTIDAILDVQTLDAATYAAEESTQGRLPSLDALRLPAEASVDSLASPHHSPSYTPSPPPPGIRLPPDVIESLQVSVSCFPETMLLTSSLSIETICAYSKKVTHRAGLNRPQWSPDNDSIYSSISHTAGPPKRWSMGSWLGHARRGSRQHAHPPLNFSYPPQGTTSTFPLPSTFRPPATSPSWAPIKHIFPLAPDRLCDALYAHLLALNYITSLCPTTASMPMPMPIPTRPPPPNASTSSNSGLSIPHKAASLLGMGMDDPLSSAYHVHPTHTQHHPQQQPHHWGSAGSLRLRRGMLGRLRRQQEQPPAVPPKPPPKDDVVAPATGSRGSQDNGGSASMRELKAGLGRCVGVLLAAVMIGRGLEGAGEDSAADGGGEGVGGEGVLVRALCELVRCVEEGGSVAGGF
ncbi:hypothetical protein C8A05DRAFT_16316 [Staphylotrichum tortipilum]|uniref:Uncharacterized protein n=1 Tax=Staphylotrichum tortipilum TaxID=2831512 RepID=A0AAN6MKG1_9PEZI|nr:hypothetical protein C8A05DRAFT_16316 [Staphylotrichum longicolle]